MPHFRKKIESFADHPLIGNVRSVGLMGGMEIVKDKKTREAYDPDIHIGEVCAGEALKRGLAFRANGDTMSLMPPLVITTEQLDTVFGIAREALDATARRFGVT